MGLIQSKGAQKRLWDEFIPLRCHDSGVIITYMTIGIAWSDLNLTGRTLRHVSRRRTSRALVSNRICCPPSHCEQTGSCPETRRHNTSNKWNKQQTFPFSPPLNDNFRAPRDKRAFGNEKNRMARQTCRGRRILCHLFSAPI